MMGWDQEFLQSAVDTCTNLSGKIEDCPLFDIQSSEDYSSCELDLPNALAEENVMSALSAIPGNPMIAYGPGYAAGASAGGAMPTNSGGTTGTVVAPTLSYTPGVSLASTETYVPGGIFAQKVTSTTVSAASSTTETEVAALDVADPTATPTPSSTQAAPTTLLTTSAPVAPATAEDGAILSTEYRTHYGIDGVTVDALIWVLDLITVTGAEQVNDYVTGAAVPTGDAAAEKKKRHVHAHRRGGRF